MESMPITGLFETLKKHLVHVLPNTCLLKIESYYVKSTWIVVSV